MAKSRYIKVPIQLRQKTVPVYASPRIAEALKEVSMKMNVYEGVRLLQVLEAVYEQGKKDGARSAFEHIEGSLEGAKKLVPYRNPGRPAGG
jgi:hypothetical protein